MHAGIAAAGRPHARTPRPAPTGPRPPQPSLTCPRQARGLWHRSLGCLLFPSAEVETAQGSYATRGSSVVCTGVHCAGWLAFMAMTVFEFFFCELVFLIKLCTEICCVCTGIGHVL